MTTARTSESITDEDIYLFQQKILSYYTQYKRHLPWRQTTNPYHILLSEFMLQQTQVSRVIIYFQQWITQWPTIQDLAQAPRSQVLHAWMGLGYNSRAVRLHQTAHIICEKYHGDILRAMHHFKDLPGIGPYTATAVRIFAANEDVVTVDTNIRRILIYEFHLPETIPDNALWTLARRCLPKGKSRDWHNALMDYGSQVLTARKTRIPPKTTQSTFEGSDRQLRGQILRIVLDSPVSPSHLGEILHIDDDRLHIILGQLQKDEILIEQEGKLKIKES